MMQTSTYVVYCPGGHKSATVVPSPTSTPDEIAAQLKRAEDWCAMKCRKCASGVAKAEGRPWRV